MAFKKQPPQQGTLLRGSTFNQIVDLLESQRRQPNASRKHKDEWPKIWVRSATDIASQTVVGLSSSVVAPGDYTGDVGFRVQHFFEVVPTTRATTKFAVTFDALKANNPARAIINGVCTVIANVTSTAHTHLAFTDVDGELESVNYQTPIQLIYAATTGDGILCKALIGGGGGDKIIRCKLTSVLELCSTATAVILGPIVQSGSESVPQDCECTEGEEIVVNDLVGLASTNFSEVGYNAPIDSNLLVVPSPCADDEYMVLAVGKDCCTIVSQSDPSVETCFPFPGMEYGDIPIGTPADVAYFLAFTADGCLIRIPKSSCVAS